MVSCVPDTGSTQTVISSRVAQRASLQVFNDGTVLRNASGKPMAVAGSARIAMWNHKYAVDSVAIVCNDVAFDALVSWHDLQKLGVISQDFPECFSTHLQNIKDMLFTEYPNVYLTALPVEPMDIKKIRVYLVDGAVPYRVSTPRPIPLRYQEEAGKSVESLLKSEIITPAIGPTDWCSPAFFCAEARYDGCSAGHGLHQAEQVRAEASASFPFCYRHYAICASRNESLRKVGCFARVLSAATGRRIFKVDDFSPAIGPVPVSPGPDGVIVLE